MKNIKKIILSIVALLPIGIPAFGQADEAQLEGPGSADTKSCITEKDIATMRSIFNTNEYEIYLGTAHRRFRSAHPELTSDQTILEFQKAVADLKARGLLGQKGVILNGVHRGWRAN